MTSPLSRRTRVLAGSALTIAAVAAASVFAAAPASAATLPADESIVTIDWNGILSTTDPLTGVLTTISYTGINAITGLDVDDAGQGYAVSYDANPAVLYTVDLVTGVLGDPRNITIDGETNVVDCTGLDYDASGVVLATCDGPQRSVGTIDPTTGIYTTVITLGDEYRIASLATDPTTGAHYGFTYQGAVLDLNLEAGTFEVVGNIDAYIYGADFDSAGVLWAVGSVYGGTYSLMSVQSSDWAVTAETSLISPPVEGGMSEALTVWDRSPVVPVVPVVPVAPVEPAVAAAAPLVIPPATLANTGLDASSLALAAGLALLTGFGAIATRRRSASRG